ncbi:hypothetical protein M569_16394 [Genlisea aurea]|uniref:Cysteine-rich transmembrane domain-containing protein n=1 Tax=Genlisea aurea TaxID=192259 RepID=S8C1Y6_9LAMI|nr:hypothetical protein M569_16394 [Genlisea aurea]
MNYQHTHQGPFSSYPTAEPPPLFPPPPPMPMPAAYHQNPGYGGYGPSPVQHIQHQRYDEDYYNTSLLRTCLAAICCCCLFEECCY